MGYTTYTDTFTGFSVTSATTLRVKILQVSSSTPTFTSRFTYLDAAVTYDPIDATAPSIPIGLGATAIGSTRVNLTWTASTDAVGVQGYKVYRNGAYLAAIGPVGSTSLSDIGLGANTTYTYKVSAIDAAGKESAQSALATAKTYVSTDTTAPSVPTGVTATASAWNSVTVTWAASTDNVGVTRYAILRGGVPMSVVDGGVTTFIDRSTLASTVSLHDQGERRCGKGQHRFRSGRRDDAGAAGRGAPGACDDDLHLRCRRNLITEATPDGVTALSTYDRAGRLVEIANVTAGGTLSRFSYALDPAGNRTVMTTTRGSQYFTYDAVNRLTASCYDIVCRRPDAGAVRGLRGVADCDPACNHHAEWIRPVHELDVRRGRQPAHRADLSRHDGLCL